MQLLPTKNNQRNCFFLGSYTSLCFPFSQPATHHPVCASGKHSLNFHTPHYNPNPVLGYREKPRSRRNFRFLFAVFISFSCRFVLPSPIRFYARASSCSCWSECKCMWGGVSIIQPPRRKPPQQQQQHQWQQQKIRFWHFPMAGIVLSNRTARNDALAEPGQCQCCRDALFQYT